MVMMLCTHNYTKVACTCGTPKGPHVKCSECGGHPGEVVQVETTIF